MKVGADVDGRRPADADHPRGDRPGPDAGGRRQPALGRAAGDRLDGATSRRSTRTGSRSRPAPTTSSATPRSPGPWRRSGSRPASTSTTGSCSSSSSRPRRSTSARSTRAGSAASTRSSRSCCWPPKFGVPVCPHAGGVGPVRARPAPVGRSTTSRSAARLDGRMIEYVDHLHEHFLDPVVIRDGALPAADRGPATAPRCGRSRWPATGSRTATSGGRSGRVGRGGGRGRSRGPR